jgi:hypothetical protein
MAHIESFTSIGTIAGCDAPVASLQQVAEDSLPRPATSPPDRP